MQCPVCVEVSLVMSERQGIEIDYCPTCRGVWLDRGELDKLIERSANTSHQSQYKEERPVREHRDHDDDYYKKKKRGGFLGDLFDFD